MPAFVNPFPTHKYCTSLCVQCEYIIYCFYISHLHAATLMNRRVLLALDPQLVYCSNT
ncbi:hypothetical protein SBA1_820019 [Candidatus Sulfotelmatobacter kueseliae]|uniref:Uncharacterized protein n=1 Tax=Candidatus Sulfotelmatobacter kueseliae TaxID=2042962 RepID=A0A2U3L8I1_9BACT|nr:hypothetical protein SBA1_820019 [Candidatus Sulfotelmatobacter kueseliae]